MLVHYKPTGLYKFHYLPLLTCNLSMVESNGAVKNLDTLISKTNTPGLKPQAYSSSVIQTWANFVSPWRAVLSCIIWGEYNAFQLVVIHLPLTIALHLS